MLKKPLKHFQEHAMLARFLQSCQSVLKRHDCRRAAGEILNDLHGPALKAYGVGRVIVSGDAVTLTLRGSLPKLPDSNWCQADAETLTLQVAGLKASAIKRHAAELETILSRLVRDGDGAHVWIVPDGYMAALSDEEKRWEREGGGYFSHEALCVQNTGAKPSRCELFVYFEAPGRDVLRHRFNVPAQSSIHLRLDKLPGAKKQPFIPKSTPVGYKVASYDAPVVVQGSRILTSGKNSEFASFGTTMAWTPG
jgi:hypothetical protein